MEDFDVLTLLLNSALWLTVVCIIIFEGGFGLGENILSKLNDSSSD